MRSALGRDGTLAAWYAYPERAKHVRKVLANCDRFDQHYTPKTENRGLLRGGPYRTTPNAEAT